MAAASHDLSIRLSVKDADLVKTVLKDVGTQGQNALKAMEVASDKATVSSRAFARQLEGLKAQLDPTIRAQREMSQAQSLLNEALKRGADQGGITAAEHGRLLEMLNQRYKEFGGGMSEAMEVSAGQSAMARRIVTANLVNVANVAVATRGNLAMMLSPVPDIVYGLRQMGGATAAWTTGMAAAGIAIGAPLALVGLRMSAVSEQTRSLTVALKAYGSQVGMTARDLQQFSEAQAHRNSPFGKDDVFEATRSLLSYRQIVGQTFRDVEQISIDFAAATNQKLPSAVSALAGALQGGYEGIKKLDQEYGFLSASQLRYIRQLEEQGRHQEAVGVALDAFKKRFQGLAEEGMGPAEKAAKRLGESWDGMLDRLGRTDVFQGLIRDLTTLANTISGMLGDDKAGASALEDRIAALRDMRKVVLTDFARGNIDQEIADLERRMATLRGQPTVSADGKVLSMPMPAAPAAPAAEATSSRSAEDIKADADRKVVDEYVDALTKQNRVYDVALGQRALMKARIEAEADATRRGLAGTERQRFIESAVAATRRQLVDASNQMVTGIRREATAADDLARAWNKSQTEAIRQEAATQAHQAALSDATVNEDRLRQAILDRVAAQRGAEAAQTINALESQVRGLEAVASAETRSQVAARETARQNEVAGFAAKLRAAAEASGSAERMAAAEDDVRRYEDLTKRRDAADIRRQAAQLNRRYDGQKAYQDEIEQLQELARTGELTARTLEDAFDQAELNRLRASREASDGAALALKEYAIDAKNAAAGTYRAFQTGLRGVEDFFVGVVTGAQSGAQAFRNFANSVVADLARMLAQKAVIAPIAEGIMGMGMFSGGGGFFSGILDGIFGGGGSFMSQANATPADTLAFWGTQLHEGGVHADGAGRARLVDPGWYENAPRYHTGRRPALGPGEIAAVLMEDEEVLTRSNPRHIRNVRGGYGGAANVNVPITVNVRTLPGTTGKVSSRRDSSGVTMDVVIEQMESGMANRIGRGEGLATVLEHRYGLNPAAGSY